MAQTVVSGNVADKEGDALAGCSVYFYRGDSIEGGISTDQKGRFELKGLPEGEYVCRVSMIGYKTASRSFTLAGKVKLDCILLEQDSKALDEVTVSIDTRELTKERAGMSIYYLSSQARNSMDAYQALKEVPRLVINQTTRSIHLDDGRTPLILVNGVKKPIDVLNPEFIESVEVIDNPSARYRGDQEVQAVLNVKLNKKAIQPYLFSNLGVKTTPNTNFIYSSASVETGTETSALYVNGGYMQKDNIETDTYSDIFQGNLHQIRNTNSQKYWNNPFFQFGGDKQFSDKNYIAYSGKYLVTNTVVKDKIDGTVLDESLNVESPLTGHVGSKSPFKTLLVNFMYRHTFVSNRTLELSGNYYYSKSSSRTDRSEKSALFSYENSIDLDNGRNMGDFKAEYSGMLNSYLHFEAGSNTEYSVTNIDDSMDSWLNYRYRRTREYIYAGIDNNQSDHRFNYVLSLGLDMAFSDADGARNSYVDLLPSVSLGYKISKRHNISLNYSRSRWLPGAGSLNPRNISTDSLKVSVGNPKLGPVHTDFIKLGYTINSGAVRFAPYIQYSYISDIIMSYGYLDKDVYVSTLRNFGHISTLNTGATLSYNSPQGKSFTGGGSVTAYYQKDYIKGMPFSGNNVGASIQAWANYRNLSLSFFVCNNTKAYSIYSKSSDSLSSQFQFGWNPTSSLMIALSGQNYLYPRLHTKSWMINGDYRAYTNAVRRTLQPEFCVSVFYTFKTKNFKWRQKKQFYGEDRELESVTTK